MLKLAFDVVSLTVHDESTNVTIYIVAIEKTRTERCGYREFCGNVIQILGNFLQIFSRDMQGTREASFSFNDEQ